MTSRDHLIPFQPEMVRAIRAGLKLETRRIRPRDIHPGDRIGVQEAVQRAFYPPGTMEYSVDKMPVAVNGMTLDWEKHDGSRYAVSKLSARYCPRQAVRTWLVVEEVREEALGLVDDAAALREGMGILAQLDAKKVGEKWAPAVLAAKSGRSPSELYRLVWEGLHGEWSFGEVVQVIRWTRP